MIIVKIMGGLGNQLFQYATGRALSIKLNTELKLDLSFIESPKFTIAYRLDRFNLPFTVAKKEEYVHLLNESTKSMFSRVLKKIGIRIYPNYKKSHVIEEGVLKLFKGQSNHNLDYYVEGWLGNERYFKDIRTTILSELNVDYLLQDENILLKNEIISTNSVAVHIRRGEYLTNTFFKSLPVQYYKNAVEMISGEIENPTFYFFSDDISWVKREFSFLSNAVFVDKNSVVESFYTTVGDIEDLMLMRTCKHNIIANSTFSWWGAWLNNNPHKKVYYPALWYNDAKAQKRFTENSFIPIKWEKVEF